jgi:hypothetical protein
MDRRLHMVDHGDDVGGDRVRARGTTEIALRAFGVVRAEILHAFVAEAFPANE